MILHEEDLRRLLKEALEQVRTELNESLLKMEEVIDLTKLSKRQINKMCAEQLFPKPRCASRSARRWLYTDILEWMRTRPIDINDLKQRGLGT